ncbi:MAG TPA: MmcQ/YjbR family DNA-binding protein [Solirubrobacteraceae bacterium]|jgi:hypothetical protein
MATWDDVRRLALSLPETDERDSRGLPHWRVREKGFVWERPLRRSDLEALGNQAPDGPILGARVEHLVAKEALLADNPRVYFTTPHFDGFPAVLVRLEEISEDELRELITEAWLSRAPKRLAADYAETHLDQG